MVLGAGSGGKSQWVADSSLRSSRGRTRTAYAVAFSIFRFLHFPRGFTERRLALSSPDAAASLVAHRLPSRQVFAMFRPHRWPDSSLCARSTRCRIRYTDYADHKAIVQRLVPSARPCRVVPGLHSLLPPTAWRRLDFLPPRKMRSILRSVDLSQRERRMKVLAIAGLTFRRGGLAA